jgi:23S rRNA (adenine2030-N6)-methyltransferase
MFIFNPPYTLEPMLRQVMPYLVQVLGKDADATFVIEKGTQLTGSTTSRSATGAPRIPVGNARRASPTTGTGSLRLPGQAPAGTPGAAGAAPRAAASPRTPGTGRSARPSATRPAGPAGKTGPRRP